MFTLAFALTLLSGVGLGYVLKSSSQIQGHRDPRYSANVFVIYETARFGKYELCIGNTVNNIGERFARNVLGFDNQSAIVDDISLGNSSIASTKTILDTEATTLGFNRSDGTAVTWMNGTDYAYNVTHKFTATGTIRINATGLHWSDTDSADNTMFALASITATTFSSNDNCTITWVITCDGN